MAARALLAAGLAAVLVAAPARADTTASGSLRLTSLGSFSSPTYAASPPGDADRIFVVEQGGSSSPARIRVLHDGTVSTFADLSASVLTDGGERGLLSLAFAPDYASSGLLYVDYTAKPDGRIRVEELRRSAGDANAADPAYRRTVIEQAHSDAPNHNGGQLQFGPDGFLYLSIGDGGGGQSANAQSLGNLLGKISRITPAGAAAPDNPFAARAGARPEIYTYGLRNPWRFSFDAATGDLVVADVGQSTREEVDFFPLGQGAGKNLGWSRWEGDFEYDPSVDLGPDPYVPPVLVYPTHVNGTCAVTGGYVVRQPALPELDGRYVYGDFCQGVLRSAALSASGAAGDAPVGDPAAPLQVSNLSSFGQDAQCRIYVISLSGPVYRLESTAATAPAGCTQPVAAGDTPVGGAGAGAGAGDRVAPVLSRLTMLRRRFAVSARATAVRAVVRPRRGSAFRYTVTERSTVTIRIDRLLAGRRVGSRCLAPTRARRTRPRCTRPLRKGTLTRAVTAGRRSTAFSGRIGRRALWPGPYRATLRATDAARNVSRPRAIGFQIVRG